MNENTYFRVLLNPETVFEATGPDAVPDWWKGGKERHHRKLAALLYSKDDCELGLYIRTLAEAYLMPIAEDEPDEWLTPAEKSAIVDHITGVNAPYLRTKK